MLAWDQIFPVLMDLFSDLSLGDVPEAETSSFNAQWHEQQRVFTHQGARTELLLQVTNITTPGGEDDRIFEMVEVGGETILAEKLKGDRLITLNVRVESLEQESPLWAWDTMERIRTRLDRTSSHARLRQVNLALVKTMEAVGLPDPEDERILSIVSMDVLFCAGFEDVDLSGALQWIERVELTSSVRDTDGKELPAPLNGIFTVDALA